MKSTHSIALSAAALAMLGMGLDSPAMARSSDAQRAARREVRAGAVQSLREIERKVLPTMPGMQYLGPEYDPRAMAYRLKFIREGHVVFVDVDARSGEVIGQSQ